MSLLHQILHQRSYLVFLLFVQSSLIFWISWTASPNLNEPAHLASGLNFWITGRNDYYLVNPPLVRIVASFPLLFTDVMVPRFSAPQPALSRPEFRLGRWLVELNGKSIIDYVRLARIACIPFSLLGTYVVFSWARESYGLMSGNCAAIFYVFCPNLIAWGASVTPDAAAASFAALLIWRFYKWAQNPTNSTMVQLGLAGGGALLTKTTLLSLIFVCVLCLVFELVFSLARIRHPQTSGTRIGSCKRLLILQFVGAWSVALLIVNATYGFEGAGLSLGDYTFSSKLFGGVSNDGLVGNRFHGSLLGKIPLPLPQKYIEGIDIQRVDFEQGKSSFLLGKQRAVGWWYYYIVTSLLKTPVGLQLAIVLSIVVLLRKLRAARPTDVLCLISSLTVFVFVSSQSGFSRHHRYVLPCIPFLIVIAASAGLRLQSRRFVRLPFFACIFAFVVESISALPHSLSFFNIAVGGPSEGHRYLLDSNVDWGQDLLRLKEWQDSHSNSTPLYVAYYPFWNVPPETVGMRFRPFPAASNPGQGGRILLPGWYAISVNFLHGSTELGWDESLFRYFRNSKPADRVGYSILVFYVSEGD